MQLGHVRRTSIQNETVTLQKRVHSNSHDFELNCRLRKIESSQKKQSLREQRDAAESSE
jgi:hypothetical protein